MSGDCNFGDFTAQKDKGSRLALFVSRVALQYDYIQAALSVTGGHPTSRAHVIDDVDC